MNRRNFLVETTLVSAGLALAPKLLISQTPASTAGNKPIVISTWKHGIPANAAAMIILGAGGSALDAVEQGVRVPEADPDVTSVGYGGLPDRDGHVTLDACIMDDNANCGSVCFLEHIMHPISVARKVMETTPHIILAGEGALQFALDNGFKKENLLTESAKQIWIKWKKKNLIPDKRDVHDTIGMLAIDKHGNLSGACTTSGLAFKLPGRVGDSPIIGAGLYVDNEVGAACATGTGELVIKIAGSFLIVELMRNGKSPAEACRIAIERIVKKQKNYKEHQVGFLALNKAGETGAYSLAKGFEYALAANGENKIYPSDSFMK